jgi:hypothetical protein
MSEWLRLVNEMKRRTPQEYFTPTQRAVYEALVDSAAVPQPAPQSLRRSWHGQNVCGLGIGARVRRRSRAYRLPSAPV